MELNNTWKPDKKYSAIYFQEGFLSFMFIRWGWEGGGLTSEYSYF